MTVLRNVLLTLILVSLAIVGGLTGCQRSMMYFPSRAVVAPSDSAIEVVRLRTEDGETLVAWWRPPPTEDSPVFLFFDGNGGRPEDWGVRWQAIASGGAGFLAVYYRGYSGSTGDPTEEGLIIDANTGYDWLISKGLAPDRIVIHGFSLGSGVAVQLAVDHKARALILEAPFTAAVDVAARGLPFLPVGLLMFDQFKSREFIARVDVPVFVAHGTSDRVIPYEMGETMYRLAPEPKSFVSVPGAGHEDLPDRGLYGHIFHFLSSLPAR